MITLNEALEAIRQHISPLPAVKVDATDAVGCALAEAVYSDVDVPPFDKAMMDGYALRATDAEQPLKIIGTAAAGGADAPAVAPGTAVRIMTGARVPEGADAVVMIERAKTDQADGHVIVQPPVAAEQHIQRQGSLIRRSAAVAGVGHVIEAEHLGALVEIGAHQVTACRRPTVAVLATGDELVTSSDVPGPNQIRNTNGPMLLGLARKLGAHTTDLGIATDDERSLDERIRRGLDSDVLLLSGGVSAGDFDLVPQALGEAGVEKVFHKVQIKPGKPLWFGVGVGGCAVFGLPGNPVSSLVGFNLFVRAAIDAMAGRSPVVPEAAALAESFQHRGDRETLFPSQCDVDGDGLLRVRPVTWRGSADLSALLRANAVARFGPGEREYAAGERVGVYRW